MRHLVVTLAVIAVLISAAIVAAPTLVSMRMVQSEVAERVGALTGSSVTLGEKPEFSVFPSPRIVLRDVAVSDADDAGHPPFVTIGAMDASLDLVSLLTGQVKVGTLTLNQPHFHLAATDREGAAQPAPAKTLKAALAGKGDLQPQEIVLRDAVVAYENGDTRPTFPIAFARLQRDREGADASAALSAWVPWCDTILAFNAELDDPAAAFSGESRPIRIAATAEPLPATPAAESGLFDGQTKVITDSALNLARRLVQDLGMPAAWSTMLGRLDIAGRFAIDNSGLTLSDAKFDIGSAVAEGNLKVDLRPDRPTLGELLASGEGGHCTFTRILNASSFAELRELPVSSRWLLLADVEFEASSERLRMAGLELVEPTLSFVSRDGQMSLGIDGENSAGGAMTMGLAMEQDTDPSDGGISVRVAGDLKDVSITDLGQFVWTQWGHPLIGISKPPIGMGGLEFAFTSHGRSIGHHVKSLRGYADANVRDGSLDGADIVATLEQLLDGDTVMIEGEGPFLPVGGRTQFRTLDARLEVGSRMARLENFRIAGDRFEILLSGTGDLVRGNMQAEGTVSLYEATADDDRRQLVELPFGIGGTMREPTVAPGVPRQQKHADRTWIFEPLDRLHLVNRRRD